MHGCLKLRSARSYTDLLSSTHECTPSQSPPGCVAGAEHTTTKPPLAFHCTVAHNQTTGTSPFLLHSPHARVTSRVLALTSHAGQRATAVQKQPQGTEASTHLDNKVFVCKGGGHELYVGEPQATTRRSATGCDVDFSDNASHNTRHHQLHGKQSTCSSIAFGIRQETRKASRPAVLLALLALALLAAGGAHAQTCQVLKGWPDNANQVAYGNVNKTCAGINGVASTGACGLCTCSIAGLYANASVTPGSTSSTTDEFTLVGNVLGVCITSYSAYFPSASASAAGLRTCLADPDFQKTVGGDVAGLDAWCTKNYLSSYTPGNGGNSATLATFNWALQAAVAVMALLGSVLLV